MKVIVLMLTLVILFLNLHGYKGYFKSAKLRNLEFKARMDKEEDKEKMKAFLVLFLIFIAFLYFTFYIMTGVIFVHGLLLVYSVFMALCTIFSFFRAVKQLADEKIAARGVMWRILLPINTLYIIYFLFYYMN